MANLDFIFMRLFFLLLWVIPLSFLISGNKAAVDTNGRCTGSPYCRACSNCSSCGYCRGGGSCGVCAVPVKKKPVMKSTPSSSTQCKAITKKGSRCSRAARSGGYCWQHGG